VIISWILNSAREGIDTGLREANFALGPTPTKTSLPSTNWVIFDKGFKELLYLHAQCPASK